MDKKIQLGAKAVSGAIIGFVAGEVLLYVENLIGTNALPNTIPQLIALLFAMAVL